MESLLADILGETVLLTLKFGKQLETGIEVPLVLEGKLLNFDEAFALILDHMTYREILVARDQIALIEKITQESEVMMEPDKPTKGESH